MVRTFIIRLQDAGGGRGQADHCALPLRGVVDEVATGLRATFRSDQELLTALTTAMTTAATDRGAGGSPGFLPD
jgi:hypothetical protein